MQFSFYDRDNGGVLHGSFNRSESCGCLNCKAKSSQSRFANHPRRPP